MSIIHKSYHIMLFAYFLMTLYSGIQSKVVLVAYSRLLQKNGENRCCFNFGNIEVVVDKGYQLFRPRSS